MSISPNDQNLKMQAALIRAAKMRNRNIPAYQIEDTLVKEGLRRDYARTVVNQVMEQAHQTRQANSNKMIVGAAVCIIGILVTVITYSSATSGGGTYIIAWGAILWGGIQFFRGLTETNR